MYKHHVISDEDLEANSEEAEEGHEGGEEEVVWPLILIDSDRLSPSVKTTKQKSKKR